MTSTKRTLFDFESRYPSLISGVFILGIVLLLSRPSLSSWKSAVVRGCTILIPPALNVSAIAIGFLATSLSILLSLANTEIAKIMKQGGHHKRLVGFIKSGITTSFVWALMSALLTSFHFDKGGIWHYGILCIWAFFGIRSILCYYRASEILLQILMLDSPSSSVDTVPELRFDDGPSIKLDLTDEEE